MGNFVCDTCNKCYKYIINLKQHMEEKHLQHEFLDCNVDGCKCKLIRCKYLQIQLQKVHGFSKVESRRAALGATRADCETQDSYYEDVSKDEAIPKLLAEEEQMTAEQHPSVNEDANDGDTSETETIAYQDDSTSVMRDSPFQDGDSFDDHSYNDVSVHSDTSQVTLHDDSEPAVLMYSVITDKDDGRCYK